MDSIKILFAKITIFVTMLSLIILTIYFAQRYPLDKSFQLATLASLAIFVGMAIILYLATLIIALTASRLGYAQDDVVFDEPEPYAIPKEERIIRHNTKEEYTEHSRTERMKSYEIHQDLMDMLQEQGSVAEVMLMLPLDLSFLLAKESIQDLFWGKVVEADKENSTITGSAGFGSTPHNIIISIQPITKRSSRVTVISKSHHKKQSEVKNISYIKKISDFFKKKEKFYLE